MREPMKGVVASLMLLLATVLGCASMGRDWDAEVIEDLRAGRFKEAVPRARRALELRERELGADHPAVIMSATNLAYALLQTGDYAGARALYERSVRISEHFYGPAAPQVADNLNNLAVLLVDGGEYAEAKALYERALRIWEEALPTDHRQIAAVLSNLGVLAKETGDFAGARVRYEKALQILEAASTRNLSDVATALNNLAVLLAELGDYDAALPIYERAVAVKERALGPYHREVAVSLSNLAQGLMVTGDLNRALTLSERALRIWERAVGPQHPDVGLGLNNLADVVQRTGDRPRAFSLYGRALAVRERSLGRDHRDVAVTLVGLADVLVEMERDVEARALYERALALRVRILGMEHPDVAASLARLAAVLQRTGEDDAARANWERARVIHLALRRNALDLDEEATGKSFRVGNADLRRYAALLSEIARLRPPGGGGSAQADAFVVVEQARAGVAQAALARASARAASADPSTAGLAWELQSLRSRRQAMRRRLVLEYGKPDDRRNPVQVAGLQGTTERLTVELESLTDRLSASLPGYAELVAPAPIDAVGVAELLRPDEALISFFTLDDRLLTWVVRKGNSLVYRDVSVRRSELARLVAEVRSNLDQSNNPRLALGELRPFNVAGSHALYRILIEPLTLHLVGVRHLIVVPDDVLVPLPLGTLITQASGDSYRLLKEFYTRGHTPTPRELRMYADVAWLARDYAITVLPSATGLRVLRAAGRMRGTGGEPFIGFGDPVLDGSGRRRGGEMLAARGPAAAVEELRRLDRLPGTRDELLTIAQALNAKADESVFLGTRATRAAVLDLNASGRLGRARVLAFATHALLTGDPTGARQPALVLTPPTTPTSEDHGLLTLEDVLTLRLGSAELVILSACNTAAGDRSGEALSGLVRAFFFAGARSLLVSHWAVEDLATQMLMTSVLRHYAGAGLNRAEALQRGMLTLLDHGHTVGQEYFVHPFAWAPFFLVGEGGEDHRRGMERQGYDVSLTRYPEGWRATFLRRDHATRPWDGQVLSFHQTPWEAVQRAAWQALR